MIALLKNILSKVKDFINITKRYGRLPISITKTGIWFYHKGDEVEWIYSWARGKNNHKWLSLGFECTFQSLKDLDEMWAGMFKELERE